MEKHRRNQIIPGVAIMVIVISLAVIFWPRSASIWDQHIQELADLSYNSQECPYTFTEIKSDREVYSNVTWYASSWTSFKQQVAATKVDVGFVTVWLHSAEKIMWVARYEDTYYYHQID